MLRKLILFFFLPLLAFGQSKYTPTKAELTKTYSRAIAEFILVAFFQGYRHQFDCMINLKYNSNRKEYELEDLQFKNYAYK